MDKIQQHPEDNVGEDFPNIIHLFKTGQFSADMATFTEVILNGKLPFLCSEKNDSQNQKYFEI